MSDTTDTIGFRQQLSMTSFEACELVIAVNIFLCTLEWQFHTQSHELTDAFWLVLVTEHKVTHCYVLNAVCHCLVAGQLYPSWRFPSADCRSFQVSNPCQAIHSILSVHHTALTDRDF